MNWIYNAGRFLADLLCPNRCPVCDRFITYNACMCYKCRYELEYVHAGYCPRCGHHNCSCNDPDNEIYYDRCFSFVYYTGNAKKGILALKDGYGVNFARYFADKAVQYLQENGLLDEIDIITAVPVTKVRMRETGYNHAFVYAKLIHRESSVPIRSSLLEKTDRVLVQHELTAAERKERAADAFTYSGRMSEVSGKTVLLCDDVITTGSTLNACAKALKNAGAKRVICAAIAMTSLEE